MKRTLSLLAISALALGTTLSAATYTITPVMLPNYTNPAHPYLEPIYTYQGAVLTPQSILINTATTGVISYDHTIDPIVEAPFNLNGGAAYYNMNLTLPEVISPGDNIIIDFTQLTGSNLGEKLSSGAYVALNENESVPANYIWVKFNDVNAFNEVYAESPVTITGLFANNRKAEGYVVDYACASDDPDRPTTQGGLVFFNEDVAPAVLAAEVLPGSDNVPEPTTATLSLLALAGLAMRRRRSA